MKVKVGDKFVRECKHPCVIYEVVFINTQKKEYVIAGVCEDGTTITWTCKKTRNGLRYSCCQSTHVCNYKPYVEPLKAWVPVIVFDVPNSEPIFGSAYQYCKDKPTINQKYVINGFTLVDWVPIEWRVK